MAVNIGPRIGIDGEAEYRKQINEITQAQKALAAEMKATESAFDKNASAQQKNAAKGKILEKQVENQEKKVKELRKGLNQASQKFGEDSAEVSKWRQAVAEAENELNRLNAELDKTKPSVGERLQEVGNKITSVGEGITSVGQGLTKYVSAPIMAVGAVAIKTAADFETAMAKVQTIADTTTVPVDELQQSILDLSDETGVAATDIAEAVYNAISAGQDTADAVSYVETTTKLARAGFTDTASALDLLTSITNAYGLEAKDATKISDKLITVQNRGKTTIAQLSSSMGKVIPTASAFGVDLDNISSAYVVMTKNGISTAESTTYLNSMLNELGKSGTKASTIIKKNTGKSFTDLMHEGKNLGEILKIVKDEADKNNLSLADLFGSAEAGKAALSLLADGGYEFSDSLQAIQSSSGATQQAFETVSSTSTAKFNETVNKLKNIGITAGGDLLDMLSPAVESVGGFVQSVADWYSSLDSDTQEMVSKVGLALGVSGPLVTGLGKSVEAIGTLTSTAGGLISKLGGMGAPVALAAGAVGLLAWSIHTSNMAHIPGYKEFMDKMEELKGKAEEVKTNVSGIHDNISKIMEDVTIETQPISDLQQQLHGCFNQTGSLKEGMESIATSTMEQLNAALGTNLPTTFSDDLANNLDILNQVDGAAQSYIQTLQAMAVQEAYQSQITEAKTEEANAMAAMSESAAHYNEVLGQIISTQEEMNRQAEILKDVDWSSGILTEDQMNAKAYYDELSWTLSDLKTELGSASEAYRENAQAAGEATSTVQGLDEALIMLQSNDPETQSKALDYLANLKTMAGEAGEALGEEVGGSLDEIEDKVNSLSDEPLEIEGDLEILNTEKESKKTLNTAQKILKNINGYVRGFDGVGSAATVAKGMAVSILSGVTGRLTSISNVATVAGGALSTANAMLSKITGRVSSIDFGSALSNAWSAAQSYFNSNPLTSYVNQVVNKISDPWGWKTKKANGGFIQSTTVAMVGEAGPEAIIPLSGTRRGRAMSLYREVGNILGAGNTTNNNSINVNVYTQPGQNINADEIAEVVSRKINAQVRRKGAVFA
jgi:TP901 family phage tail tape measure protein